MIAEELLHERGRVRALFQALARLEASNARHADAVLTTSAYCRQAVERHYRVPPAQVRLVPEGIDLARWRAGAQASDGATILCVARQYPRKHVADLLHAMPAVLAAHPRARAIIVGDGPEHGNLRALAARLGLGPAAVLTGALPDDELAQLYRQASIFCLPSVQEGFGIVFLEAMARGLPVVATTAAAIPEVVPHGQAGLLVPPSSPAALAEALNRLLADARLRAELGGFAAAYVEQYDWARVAERFLEAVRPFVPEH